MLQNDISKGVTNYKLVRIDEKYSYEPIYIEREFLLPEIIECDDYDENSNTDELTTMKKNAGLNVQVLDQLVDNDILDT